MSAPAVARADATDFEGIEKKVAAAEKKVEKAKEEVAAAKEEVAAAKEEVAAAKEEFAAAGTDIELKATANLLLKVALEGLQTAQDGVKSAQQVLDDANEGLIAANKLARQATQRLLDTTSVGGAQAASEQALLEQVCSGIKNLQVVTQVIKNSLPEKNSVIEAPSIAASDNDSQSTKIYDEAMASVGVSRALQEDGSDIETKLPHFDFRWQGQAERAAYAPLMAWCDKYLPFKSHDVSQGQNCSQENLFHVTLWSCRQHLWQHGIEARIRPVLTLKGKPDIVLTQKLPPGRSILFHNRVHVLIEIEVKRQLDKSEVTGACREAERYLLGLSACNKFSSPVVLLTDLTSFHRVLFVEAQSDPLSFCIVSRQFEFFHVAVQFCLNQKPATPSDQLGEFGRPVTPLHEDNEVGSSSSVSSD